MRIEKISVDAIDDSDRVRREFGDLEALAASLDERGLLHPIVVRGDKRLLCGGRRLAAARNLGWKTIEANVYDSADAYAHARLIELEENDLAKPWTPSERVEIFKLVKAEQMSKAGQGRRTDLTSEKFPEVAEARTSAAKAAEKVGWSRPTAEKAAEIVEAAEEDPEEYADLVEKMDASGKVNGAWLELQNRKGAHVANNSGNNEWYTPARFIEAARDVMGSIDTDPASCAIANNTVQADTFYTKEDSGLEKGWHGNVWMNPPYAQPLISQFCEKLVTEYMEGRVVQAIVLVNNGTETAWGQGLLRSATGVCFPAKRVKFLDPDGNPSGAPLQGQMIVYFGDDTLRFRERFSEIGVVF